MVFLKDNTTTVSRIRSADDVNLVPDSLNVTKEYASITIKGRTRESYVATINLQDGSYHCACDDYRHRHVMCKHILALLKYLKKRRPAVFRRYVEVFLSSEGHRLGMAGAKYSTGIKALDDAIHGGLPASQVIGLVGQSNVGKTRLAIQIAANIANTGKKVIYVDTENLFNNAETRNAYFNALSKLGMDVEKLKQNIIFYYSASIDDLTQLLGLDVKIKDAGKTDEGVVKEIIPKVPGDIKDSPIYGLVSAYDAKFVVIDSLSTPIKKAIPSPPKQNNPPRAVLFSLLFSRLYSLIDEVDASVMAVHHLTRDPTNIRDVGKVWGGETILYFTKYLLVLRNARKACRERYAGYTESDGGPREIIVARWGPYGSASVCVLLSKDVGYV